MYLNSINIYNIGPIDKCSIKAKFDENGNPYPIVIIGDNGKGKTILSSYIADSILELAKSNSTYDNIVEQQGAYYRIISSTNIKNGKNYSATILSFKDNNNNYFSYVEKAGEVNIEEIKDEIVALPKKDNIVEALNKKREL